MNGTSTMGSFARQRVLDASLGLMAARRSALAELARGDVNSKVVLVAGGERLNEWMLRTSRGWRHLLSARPSTTADHLETSLPNNRLCVQRGLRMVSIFDADGTEPAAREMLRGEAAGYLFGCAPMQMRLVDQREVYLHGPSQNGEDSILRLRTQAALRAARAYWQVLRAEASPCSADPAEPELSERQRVILDLLGQELTDERIADHLGLSVRTVRADIASAMQALGARSRFAAGYAFASLTKGTA